MLSGVLSAVMVLSVAAGPVSALASDTKTDPKKNLEEYVSSLPDLDDARDSLDRDEIVTAKDLELDYGAEIDLKKDYTGIRIPDKKKISVSFYEAKNEDGKSFTTSRADTYKAVYYAEPVNTEHPAYRFSRNITVREEMKEKAGAKSPATETGGTASKAESVASSGKASAGDSGESTESEEDTESDSSAKASEEAVLKTGLNASGEEKETKESSAAASTVAVPEGSVSRFLESAGADSETVSVKEKTAAANSGTASVKAKATAVDSENTEAKEKEEASSGETAVTASEEKTGTEDKAVSVEAKDTEKETGFDAKEKPAEDSGTTVKEDAEGNSSSAKKADTEAPKDKEAADNPVSTEATNSAEAGTESAASSASSTEAGSAEDLDQKLEEAENQDTYDEDSGWTVSGVLKWATEEEEISLAEMGVGDSVTFDMPKKKMALKAAPSTGTMKVEITKGERYHFYDYGLGTFWTHPFYVKYGNISATASCIETSKSAPDSGTYTITTL